MEDRTPKNPAEIYLTREQIFRLAGLANDALVGIQIGSDYADNTRAYCAVVQIEGSGIRHYEIEPDGSYKDVT